MENQKKLTELFNKAKEIQDKYSYADWCIGIVATGDKRAHTIRFNKFYNEAINAGFDMFNSIPDCLKPNK